MYINITHIETTIVFFKHCKKAQTNGQRNVQEHSKIFESVLECSTMI